MSLENFSYVIAIILLIASIVSPIATAIINNIHTEKIKKLEILEAEKKSALSNFINSAQLVAYDPNDVEKELEYQTAFNTLFVYFPNMKLDVIYPFEKCRANVAQNDSPENYQYANHALTNIIQDLSKQIGKI